MNRSTRTPSQSRKRDRHQLYQISVQNTKSEVAFMRRVFRKTRGREARTLREDFCGTAILSATWVERVPEGRAQGVDLDLPTLEYARRVNVEPLGDRAERVELIHGNVLEPGKSRPDVVAAYNFSYFIFKKRGELLEYFRKVRGSLGSEGIFFLDIYGGPEAQFIQEEETDHGEFTYVWDQARYNPITGEILCHIHFDFEDGPRMKRAFTYDWRLWGLPEVQDALAEAGFSQVDVYWEGTDRESGEGNGVFKKSLQGDNSLCWVAYIVAHD